MTLLTKTFYIETQSLKEEEEEEGLLG